MSKKTALIVVCAALALVGCASYPCFYQGKGVSRENAQRMRELGMHVSCAGDKEPPPPPKLRPGGDVE